MTTALHNIAVSPRFFRTERQNYSHWIRAWARESLQNSFDANASKIAITLTENCVISFSDNGCGMSEDILINKFLTLGETGKSEGTVGGFGKAKILLCFANKSYTIRSQDWVCEGVGGSYTIEKSDQFLRGTTFVVALDTMAYDSVIDAIKYVFALSNFRGEATLNGEVLECGYNKGRMVKELSFGLIYHNKSSSIKNKVIYRVNGVYMFECYTNLDSCLTIEIDPIKSRDILLSNRDSLQYEYKCEADQFINKLAVEKEHLLKKKSKQFLATFGGGFLKFNKKKTAPIKVGNWNPIAVAIARGTVTEDIVAAQQDARFNFQTPREVATEAEVLEERDPILETMIVVNESEDPKIATVAKTYFPSHWQKYNSGGDKLKLLKMWNAAIEISLEKLCEKTGRESVSYAVGFIFSTGEDKTLAQCRKVEGGYYFLINVTDDKGKMNLSLNNKGDLFKLLMRGSHEVSHVFDQSHSVDFAYMRDDIMEMILEDSNEALNKLKEAKNN